MNTLNNKGIPYLDQTLVHDKNYVLSIVESYPGHFIFCDHFADDIEVVLKVVKLEGALLEFASDNLRNNPLVVKTALENDVYAVAFIGKDLLALIPEFKKQKTKTPSIRNLDLNKVFEKLDELINIYQEKLSLTKEVGTKPKAFRAKF